MKKLSSLPLLLAVLTITSLALQGRIRGAAMTAEGAGKTWKRGVSNILEQYLRPPDGREIVIVYDHQKALLAGRLRDALEHRGNPVTSLVVGQDTGASLREFHQVLANDQVGLIVLASPRMYETLGLYEHLQFDDNLPSIECACDPVFFDTVIPTENLVRLYSVDPADTGQYIGRLEAQLPGRAEFHLTAPGGTHLKFTSRNWRRWPWEIATYPVEDSVHGTIVVDGAVFFSLIKAPIRLTIQSGKLSGIECLEEGDPVCTRYIAMMRQAFERNPLNWQLAEVGIGANRNARLSDILMESESVRGTCHFCFGDNSEFGGQNLTGWHGGTVIVKQPVLKSAGVFIDPGIIFVGRAKSFKARHCGLDSCRTYRLEFLNRHSP